MEFVRFQGIWMIIHICTFGLLSAQDWAPIRFSDETYAFQVGTNPEPRFIRVEERSEVDTDSLYSLNTIIRPCDSCTNGIFLYNQAHFLQKNVQFNDAGVYHFHTPGSFVIQSLANVGESWLFDTLANVMATVQSIESLSVLGQMDEVKQISLSSGGVIELSQHHGLLSFSLDSTDHFQLLGVQRQKLGLHMPKFRDFFVYEVGDEMQTYSFTNDFEAKTRSSIKRFEIVGKSENEGVFTYEIEGLGREIEGCNNYYNCERTFHHPDTTYFSVTETLTFEDDPAHLLNHMYTSYPIGYYGSQPVIFVPQFFTEGGISNHLKVRWKMSYQGVYDMSLGTYTDHVEEVEEWQDMYYLDLSNEMQEVLSSTFELGIGQKLHISGPTLGWEQGHGIKALKRGEQIFGQFSPDHIFIESTSSDPVIPIDPTDMGIDNVPADLTACEPITFLFHPESGLLEVKFEEEKPRTFELIGMDGRRIRKEPLERIYHAISFSELLQPGVYIARIEMSDGCFWMRKLLVR